MRAVPMELPVNAGEAGTLAGIVLDQAEGKALDPVRGRIATLIGARKFTSFTPFPGSLQRDPIHPATFYLAADDILLRLASASSPSSGLFPHALLIGRMRIPSGREVVVNAIPFAASDHDNIRTYAEQVDRSFLPRTGLQKVGIIAEPKDAVEAWHQAVWQVIRSGGRQGWSATLALAPGEEPVLAGDFTRFSVREETGRMYALVRAARGRANFDFELDLSRQETETTPQDLRDALAEMRAQGQPAQFVVPRLSRHPRETLESRLTGLYEAAREGNVILSLDPDFRQDSALVGRLTGGRVNYRVRDLFPTT